MYLLLSFCWLAQIEIFFDVLSSLKESLVTVNGRALNQDNLTLK
jgi:hypothetical protein